MPNPLFTEARRVAQEFDLEVIPCGDRKQPLQKGWRKLATADPQEEDFRGATYVGVPAGESNDLIVFDLDYDKRDDDGVPQPASNEVWDRLADFEEELLDAYPGQVRIHKTQSGGVHLIMRYPAGKKIARNPMPNMEVIMEGFQFIWPTEGSGYTVEEDVPLDDLAEPDDRFLKVRYRAEGMSTGSGLMTPEKAHEVMLTDGEIGTRHDALLRITQDMVGELHDDHLRSMTDAQIAELIQRHLESVYGHALSADRAAVLFEVRAERDGSVSGGELGRALAGPLKQRRAMLGDRFAALAAKKAGVMAEVKKSAAELYQEKSAGAKSLFEVAAEKKAAQAGDELGEFVEDCNDNVNAEDLPDIEWLVKYFIPDKGLTSITGPSGVGKTRYMAALISALSAGKTELIGLEPIDRPLRTMYFANEERVDDVRRRIKAFNLANGTVQGSGAFFIRGKENGPLQLVNGEGAANTPVVDKLIEDAKARHIDVMIFDPFVTLGGQDENAQAEAGLVIAQMQRIMNEAKCAVVFIHHSVKDRDSPADDLRGTMYAWRGASVIYSSLDFGVTLFPYLPPICYDKTNGKANREKLRRGQVDQLVPKYVRFDPAKTREGDALKTAFFELVSQPLRDGGDGIGALRPVSEQTCKQVSTAFLQSFSDGDINVAMRMNIWHALIDGLDIKDRVTTSLSKMVHVVDKAKIPGWEPAGEKEQVRSRNGVGKRLIDALEGVCPVRGGQAYMVIDDKTHRIDLVFDHD